MERGNVSFLCIFTQPPPRQWLQVTLTNPRGTLRDLLPYLHLSQSSLQALGQAWHSKAISVRIHPLLRIPRALPIQRVSFSVGTI